MTQPIGTHIEQPSEHIPEIKKKHVTYVSPFITRAELAEYRRCTCMSFIRRVKKGMIKESREDGSILYHVKENNIKLSPKQVLRLQGKLRNEDAPEERFKFIDD